MVVDKNSALMKFAWNFAFSNAVKEIDGSPQLRANMREGLAITVARKIGGIELFIIWNSVHRWSIKTDDWRLASDGNFFGNEEIFTSEMTLLMLGA